MTLIPLESGQFSTRAPLEQTSSRIRVFVVHNHPVFRFGIVSVLRAEPTVQCVGEASDLAEALHTAAMLAPDVVVLDRNLPDAGDTEALETLRIQVPQARLIVLASRFDPQGASSTPVMGACAVLPRNSSASDLVAAIAAAFHNPNVPVVPRNIPHVGKPVGADLHKGFPRLIGLGRSRQLAEEEKNKAVAALKSFGQRASFLRELAGYVVSRET